MLLGQLRLRPLLRFGGIMGHFPELLQECGRGLRLPWREFWLRPAQPPLLQSVLLLLRLSPGLALLPAWEGLASVERLLREPAYWRLRLQGNQFPLHRPRMLPRELLQRLSLLPDWNRLGCYVLQGPIRKLHHRPGRIRLVLPRGHSRSSVFILRHRRLRAGQGRELHILPD